MPRKLIKKLTNYFRRTPRHQNGDLLADIMTDMSNPLVILDSRNHIMAANKSARALLGPPLLKKKISAIIKNAVLDDALRRVHATGMAESCELKFGTSVAKHYLTHIQRVHRDKNQTALSEQFLFLTLYDVSALKRTDKMRVDFVANASHELRTPLSSILGFVETLQGPARDDPDAHDRFLTIMHDEASRMSRLIEDLLSLSRIERDEHIPPSQNVNLIWLIENVIKVLEPLAKDKEMTINFAPSSLKNITADPDQLTQVFQNLIENAVKYGNRHSEIIVTCQDSQMPAPAHRKEAMITVTNEGPGIPAKHLPRLMERFYRVDSARSRTLGGTGLGLAIVKHIIQRHRGRIRFESDINATTTVTITLPA